MSDASWSASLTIAFAFFEFMPCVPGTTLRTADSATDNDRWNPRDTHVLTGILEFWQNGDGRIVADYRRATTSVRTASRFAALGGRCS